MRGTLPAFLAALLTTFSLFALAGYQVTSEQPATRLLGRLGAALIEIDRWLPAHKEDIDLLARDRPNAVIEIKDLPLAVSLPSSQVIDRDEPAVRALMVRTMGETLYENGSDTFRDAEGNPQKPGYTEPARWSVMLLNKSMHSFWQAVLALSLLALVAVVAWVLMAGKSPLTPLALGGAFAASLSLAAWLLAQAGDGMLSAPVDKEIMLSLRDGAWIGLRNGLALSVAFLGLSFLLGTFMRPREEDTWTPGLATDFDSEAPAVWSADNERING